MAAVWADNYSFYCCLRSGIFVCHLTYFIEYFRMEYGQTISVLLSLLVLFVYVIIGNGRDVYVYFVPTVTSYFLFAFFAKHFSKR